MPGGVMAAKRKTMSVSALAKKSSIMRRRAFLKNSAVAVGTTALSFAGLTSRIASAAVPLPAVDYGPLSPVADQTTGLSLISLPQGFRYSTFGWTGDLMEDGIPTPALHDGMAVVSHADHIAILIRNHEISSDHGSFGAARLKYDPAAGGGCTNLMFNTGTGKWLKSWSSLGGTVRNCAGGPTPWGSWLTCEETLIEPGHNNRFTKTHGWIFEVPAVAQVNPEPLTAMGRFNHEAAAVDPVSGYVYLTEDTHTAGFYRFVPKQYGKLQKGGQLQMLKVKKHFNMDFSGGHARQSIWQCEWVSINNSEWAHTPGTRDGLGVFTQGYKQGGAVFKRGEGCWYDNGNIYFVSTTGGVAGHGQIWQYHTDEQWLQLLFESPSQDIINNPDNITVSPRGGILLCEDGDRSPQKLQGLSLNGHIFSFAENRVVLKGEKNNIRGDFTASEWAGATFAGEWLFVNIQEPGITFAVTGPWRQGML